MTKKDKSLSHAFEPGRQADFIVEYLNGSDRPPDDPVERWIVLEGHHLREWTGESNYRDEIVKFLNDMFSRPGFGWRRVATSIGNYYDIKSQLNLERPLSPAEAKPIPAFNAALELFSLGLLDRIRRCAHEECSKWFYAKLAYQRFHSDECRSAALAADPGRKQRRAKYMRENRRTKKNLALARKKGGKKP
ncbi:MAG TPA: hypothetical protein VJW94_18170 [Candidatus Acidoferrum sp.]|nr:hypothetical protein [Candidatus Acidoferrum sp.]